MKKKVLISMYSLHIGGAERSLIGLLESFDYSVYEVDLFLYRHEGEFLRYIPKGVNVLPSIKAYTTFERPVKEILKEGHLYLGAARVFAKYKAKMMNRGLKNEQGTYKQMQYIWKYSIPKLPKLEKQYDVGISFLGPHNFMLDKVKAITKFGWSHTDYYKAVYPDKQLDEKMWNRLDYIVNVSKECEESFLKVFPNLKHKALVIENIISPIFVREQAAENIASEMPVDGSIKICSVGRFSSQKGFDMAVLACKRLVQLGYDIKWYIVGYGTEEENIKQLIHENNMEGRFILLGKKINPYPYMKNCDIYCQPSRYEGKAVTVREAQILGKPVVITNFPTSKDQLQDKVDGYICPADVAGIVQGITELIENVSFRNRIAQNTLLRNYGNETEVEKIYKLVK